MKNKKYIFCKRVIDIVAASIGLVVTSPVWLFAIIGIKISDPGPVFFKAQRVGKDNKEFAMWKFRSMRLPRNDMEKNESSFKADTNRIFAFGELCRSLKIDELPQLLNILFGTMTLVGPRPAAKDQVSEVRAGKYEIASTVKPGLTGPAALYDYIYGDTVTDLEDYRKLVLPTRLELEAYYPEHMGLLYDTKMIWYTTICVVCAVFKKKPQRIYKELTQNIELDELHNDSGLDEAYI